MPQGAQGGQRSAGLPCGWVRGQRESGQAPCPLPPPQELGWTVPVGPRWGGTPCLHRLPRNVVGQAPRALESGAVGTWPRGEGPASAGGTSPGGGRHRAGGVGLGESWWTEGQCGSVQSRAGDSAWAWGSFHPAHPGGAWLCSPGPGPHSSPKTSRLEKGTMTNAPVHSPAARATGGFSSPHRVGEPPTAPQA